MTQLAYSVIEYFEDAPPEPFSDYWHFLHAPHPAAGESIRLRWPDGHDAYRARVIRCDGMHLHVRSEDEWDLFCDLWRGIYAHWETYGKPPDFRKAADWMASGGFMGAAMRRGSEN